MTEVSNKIVNVPNALTLVRLILAIIMFIVLPWRTYGAVQAALVLFIVAASTDWIDGYWARKYNQITKLGRVFDPFVDKIIICGSYVYLAAEQAVANQAFGITAWMAVVVLGREMLVTALRSAIEQAGGDFSAKWAAKWKMLFQCFAVGAALVCLMYFHAKTAIPDWLWWTQVISNVLAIGFTVYSGAEYVLVAARTMSK